MADLLLPFWLLFGIATYALFFRRAGGYWPRIIGALGLSYLFFLAAAFVNDEKPGITGEIPPRWPGLKAVWRDEAGPPLVLVRPHFQLSALYPYGLAPGSLIIAMAGERLATWQELEQALAAHPREGVLTGSLIRRALQRELVFPLSWLESEEGISWEEEVMASLGLPPRGLPVWEAGREAKSWGIFPGTVIYSLNGGPANRVSDWHSARTKVLESGQGADLALRILRPFKVRAVKAWPGENGWGITLPPALQLPTRFHSIPPLDAFASVTATLARAAGFQSSWQVFRFLPRLPLPWYKIPSFRWQESAFWLYKLGTSFVYLALALALLLIASRLSLPLTGPWPVLFSYAVVAILLLKDFFRVLHV